MINKGELLVRETGLHIIGKCQGCGLEHDGPLVIAQNEHIERFFLCVVIDGTFHALEFAKWPEESK